MQERGGEGAQEHRNAGSMGSTGAFWRWGGVGVATAESIPPTREGDGHTSFPSPPPREAWLSMGQTPGLFT